MSSWMVDRAVEVAGKFQDEDVFARWVDATLPFMGKFLGTQGWNGWIVVHDEAGEVLLKIEPGKKDQPAKQMNLVRSDNKFRLQSSSILETESGWVPLFESLAAQLEKDEAGKRDIFGLLYLFNYFTTTEKHCPLGETVKNILGK
ncbi:hypothetical protein ACCS93_38960 [Rhizobium ruizarguesonis]